MMRAMQMQPVGKGGDMRDNVLLGPMNRWARLLRCPGDHDGRAASRDRDDPAGVERGGNRLQGVVRGGGTLNGLSWRVVMGRVDAIAVGGHNRAVPAAISRMPTFDGES